MYFDCECDCCVVDLIAFSPASGSDNVSCGDAAGSSNVEESAVLLGDEVRLTALLFVSISSSVCVFFIYFIDSFMKVFDGSHWIITENTKLSWLSQH